MYIIDAEIGKHSVPQPVRKEVNLFGNIYQVYDHEWRNHLHIICTYQCNAKCEFCVEKNSKCNEKLDILLDSVKDTLKEMDNAGILHTVSITGGEPMIFPKIIELTKLIKQYDVFLTINTNGSFLSKHAEDLDGIVDFINISRHYVDDNKNLGVFKNKHIPSLFDIYKLKGKFKNTSVRIQAVVNEDTSLKEYLEIPKRGYVDDLSFRQLMLDGSKESLENRELYRNLVKQAVASGTLVEQEIQDYYVYETHNIEGIDVTFSYSDMKALEDQELDEDDNFIREFIIRPDGTLSGSWFSSKIKSVS